MNQRFPRFLQILLFSAAVAVITTFWMTVLLFVLTRPTLRVMASWESPGPVDAGYHLTVIETDWDLRGFPLHLERNTEIYVGRDQGKPSYGHLVKYGFSNSLEDYNFPDRHVGKCKVTWSREGVTLAEPDGHRLFVPGDAYRGGR